MKPVNILGNLALNKGPMQARIMRESTWWWFVGFRRSMMGGGCGIVCMEV